MNLDDLLHKPKRNIVWSDMQEAIFAADGPKIIQGVAGCSKTTTLVEDTNRRGGEALMLAFNKGIATELASRVSGATVKTLNALGHQILMRKHPGAKLDSWRISKRLRQVMDPASYQDFGKATAQAISLAKANAIFAPVFADFVELMTNYELEVPTDMLAPLARVAERVWKDMMGNAQISTFDFDDQLFIPIRDNHTFPLFDYIYVDEAQDLSPIQHLMVGRMVDRGAILTAVGDRAQAIYGFRGATSDSMDLLKQTFRLKELPLSITYRCPKSVVSLAQQFVPQILAAPWAKDGEVRNLDQYPDPAQYQIEDLIVCRNNAPIFSLALQFVRVGLPCRVMSNFLEVLEKFIEDFDAQSSKDLRTKLDVWYGKEKTLCENSGRFGRLSGIEDRYQTLVAFCEKFDSVDEIIRTIRQLATSTNGPRIATIHKAKGLEADHVFILRPDLLPSPRAQSEAQIQAERNLQYVGITRAASVLTFLPREEG